MDATWRGRRSDALYQGSLSKRDLCNMIARLEDEAKEMAERLESAHTHECEYKIVSNITRGLVSYDCMGLECTRCGRQQLSLDAPKFCPDCGARVRR